jgi:hypothetical protein
MTQTRLTPPAFLPVLVATKATQGQRTNDFCWCDEDEPVRFGTECDGEKVDGRCGCRRSMTGLSTLKATTTMKVKQLPITRSQYVDMLKSSYDKAGFGFALDDADIAAEADQLLSLAAAFVGVDAVEKRGNKLKSRAAKGR